MGSRWELGRLASHTSTMKLFSRRVLKKAAFGLSRKQVRPEPDEVPSVPCFVFLQVQEGSFTRVTWLLPATQYK